MLAGNSLTGREKRGLIVLAIFLTICGLCTPFQEIWSQERGSSPGTVAEDSPEIITFQSLPPNFEYNAIRCILKDQKGYMWFGSSDGLVRYDGINLYLYEHLSEDSTSLSHNAINALVEDEQGNLWIGTSVGLNRYNREMDNFIRIGNLHEDISRLGNNYITDLAVDKNSRIWIGTFGDGVNVYDPQKQKLIHYPYDVNDPDSINSNRINSIAVDKDNNVWLGTKDGLSLLSENREAFRHFINEPGNPNSLSSNNINSIVTDSEGNVWIGTRGSGLDKVSCRGDKFIFRHYRHNSGKGQLSNDYILSLSLDPKGYLWIGTENGGLNRLSLPNGQIDVFLAREGDPQALNSNSIWSLYTDDEGRLWIGHANRGINVIDVKHSKFESYRKNIFYENSLPDNDVKGFAEDSEGKVWIATDGGGICKFDPETRSFSHFIRNTENTSVLVNNAIQDIYCDPEGNLWLGIWAGGIDRLDPNGRRIRNYRLESDIGVGNSNVFTLYADDEGLLWAGTSGIGLFLYDEESDEFRQVVDPEHADILSTGAYITSMLKDRAGRFWIASLNGVVLLEKDAAGKIHVRNILPPAGEGNRHNRSVVELFEDSRGRIWFGTPNDGLYLYTENDSSITVINKRDGLTDNTVAGILEDEAGNLWISSNKGITCFNYDSLNFTHYTREDGLNSNEFYSRACIKTRKGQFFFGGENGFDSFFPERIRKNEFIPPVYLTTLKINNIEIEPGAENSPLVRHISETGEITLDYKQSSFTIEFVALNYTRPTRNQFVYKLEGFDDDWNYAGTSHSASYTTVKHGRYVFMVKGSNNDGIWNENPTELKIRIKPPVWKTWWAITVYILLLSAIILISMVIWNERIRIKHQLKLEQLAREREHELNEANIQFFTNISHEFRTPLSLIIGPLESLILSSRSKIKDQLVVVYRNALRLLHLTNDLMDFRKLEEGMTRLQVKHGDILHFCREVSSYFTMRARRRNIEFRVYSGESGISAWFDPDKLETMLLNLVSNAFKNTPDKGKILVNVRLSGGNALKRVFNPETISDDHCYCIIEVTDNGKGITSADLPYIFDKFYQSETAERKKDTGTGIGLALTKGLVELHHGFIKAESTPGKKTIFTLAFPVDEKAYSQEERQNEPADVLSRTILREPAEIVSDEKKPDPVDHETSDERTSIMVVEDNAELRAFLVSELAREFKVFQAEEGKAGLELATEEVPDLILSDIIMPGMNGIDLCKAVKDDIRTCHIPFILLTAKTTINERIEGVEIGADAYITKPFNMQFLFTQINQMIQSRRKLYAHFSQDVYMMPLKLTEKDMDQKFLQRVINYIIANITDNALNVEMLASEMNLSRSNIYRKIKALTGKTIVEFIRIVKLKHAVKLMETKEYSLAEIAYLTGFSSPSYFTKSFKDQYGKPPSEFIE